MTNSTAPTARHSLPTQNNQDVGEQEVENQLVNSPQSSPQGVVFFSDRLFNLDGLGPLRSIFAALAMRGLRVQRETVRLGRETRHLDQQTARRETENEGLRGENAGLGRRVERLTTQNEQVQQQTQALGDRVTRVEQQVREHGVTIGLGRQHGEQMRQGFNTQLGQVRAQLNRVREAEAFRSVGEARGKQERLANRVTSQETRINGLKETYSDIILELDYQAVEARVQELKERIEADLANLQAEQQIRNGRDVQALEGLENLLGAVGQRRAEFERALDGTAQQISELATLLHERREHLNIINVILGASGYGRAPQGENVAGSGLILKCLNIVSTTARLKQVIEQLGQQVTEEKKQNWVETLKECSRDAGGLSTICQTAADDCRQIKEKILQGNREALGNARVKFEERESTFSTNSTKLKTVSDAVDEARRAIGLQGEVMAGLEGMPSKFSRVDTVKTTIQELASSDGQEGWPSVIEGHRGKLTTSKQAFGQIQNSCQIIRGFQQGEAVATAQLRQNFTTQVSAIADIVKILDTKEKIAGLVKTSEGRKVLLKKASKAIKNQISKLSKKHQSSSWQNTLSTVTEHIKEIEEKVGEGWTLLNSTEAISDEKLEALENWTKTFAILSTLSEVQMETVRLRVKAILKQANPSYLREGVMVATGLGIGIPSVVIASSVTDPSVVASIAIMSGLIIPVPLVVIGGALAVVKLIRSKTVKVEKE